MKIPEYSRRVMPNPMPTVGIAPSNLHATDESFGAGNARLLGAFGTALQGVGEQVIDEVNKTNVRNALNQAREQTRALMNDIQSKKGEQAQNAFADAQQGIQKIRETAAKSFTLPAQTTMFNSVFDSMAASDLDTAMAHQTRERQVFKEQTWDAENANDMQDAARNIVDNTPASAEVWKNSVEGIKRNTAAKYAPYGAEVVKAKTLEAMNAFHLNIADSLLKSNQTKRAIEYMASNKSEIGAEAYSQRMAVLDQFEKEEKAHSYAVDALDAVKRGIVTPERELELIRTELPAELSRKVEANFLRWMDEDAALAKRAEREKTEAQVSDIVSAFDSRRDTITSKEIDGAIDQAEKKYGFMDPQTKMNLRDSMARQIAARDNPMYKAAADAERYRIYGELTNIMHRDPARFAAMNLQEYAPALGSLSKEFMDKQAEIRSGKVEKTSEEKEFFAGLERSLGEGALSTSASSLKLFSKDPVLQGAEATRRQAIRGFITAKMKEYAASLPPEKRTNAVLEQERTRLMMPMVGMQVSRPQKTWSWTDYLPVPVGPVLIPFGVPLARRGLSYFESEKTLTPYEAATRLDNVEKEITLGSTFGVNPRIPDSYLSFIGLPPPVENEGAMITAYNDQHSPERGFRPINALYTVEKHPSGMLLIHAYGPQARVAWDQLQTSGRMTKTKEGSGKVEELVMDERGNPLKYRFAGAAADEYAVFDRVQ